MHDSITAISSVSSRRVARARAGSPAWLASAVASLGLLAACGSDAFEPRPLVDDPAVQTGCAPGPVNEGQSRAKRVECAEELPAGLLVAGRAGDVVVENSLVRFVIRGFGDGYYLLGTGPGGIVDAARVDGEDAIKEIVSVFSLSGAGAEEIAITEAGDDGPATVVVRGPVQPIPLVQAALSTQPAPAIIEQHYVLEPDTDALLVRTFVFAAGEPARVTVGDAFFFGGAVRSFLPGTGFIEGAANGELIASEGASSSYGIVYRAGSVATLQWLDVANIKIGLGPDRDAGDREPVERFLIVGDGSVSSVTDRAFALLGRDTGVLRGTVAIGATPAGVSDAVVAVAITDADGNPITRARVDASGAYRVALPPGSYSARAIGAGRAEGDAQSAQVTADVEAVLDLVAGDTGALTVTAQDEAGEPLPARVMVDDRAGAAERRIEYTGADGALALALPPGEYAVTVSRGMEYDAFVADPVVIAAGEAQAVAASLARVVDTAGWIALDTHLHSEMSTDSTISLPDRLRAVAAEGVEVAIATDHDFVSDYGPVIDALGLGAWVAARSGVETSSLVWGHVNTWPLAPDYDRAAGGAIPWFDRTPGDVFALMRERGRAVIQVNHPYHPDSGLFDIADYDPDALRARRDPAVLGLAGADLGVEDFDALEVANDFSRSQFDDSFAAWLRMVAAGHPAVATGSSDSHGKTRFAGNSRTYVFVGPGADDPAAVDPGAVDDALRAGAAVVAQGAFVIAAVRDPAGADAAPGALVDLSELADPPEAQLHIVVQAPPWLPVQQIVVYAVPDVALTIPLDPQDTAAVRFDGVVTVPIGAADGAFVVRVDPAGPGTPVLGQPVASFTNPLRYDRDGDGAWTPAQ